MDSSEYPFRLRIKRQPDVYLAMVETERIALIIGFDTVVSMKIKTAVSELATNILKYAGKGRIEISSVKGSKKGIKIVVSDNGPGIKNLNMALQNNYSSGGSLGLGLPGVKRLMDIFEIDSEHNRGTIITIVKWLN